MSDDHNHDAEGNCIPNDTAVYTMPSWRFSGWDVVGIGLTGIAGLLTVSGQALNLLSREFGAMANYTRQNYDLKQARRQYEAAQASMAANLRELVDGPGGES